MSNSQASAQLPEAEALLKLLVEAMRPLAGPAMALVGIHTGGVWLAEQLHAALGLVIPLGSIDVSFHRDDYSSKGLHRGAKASSIPFDVDGAQIVLVDDVLYTGRTIRAAMNELYDYGRPGRVDLAVLVDRGGRELPISARYCACTLDQPLPATQELVLTRTGSETQPILSLSLKERRDA
ncbi:MAG: bifunctional pyr operon transcriptional regulator/uracil phosphoribosyltransferase PyrR [Proteobacteria bacterium]|nr:bifunctional pyr operon transcriptional regulator/uracil phosphoribosyltransferase PyrR [Pseudomonadota bacterium]